MNFENIYNQIWNIFKILKITLKITLKVKYNLIE